MNSHNAGPLNPNPFSKIIAWCTPGPLGKNDYADPSFWLKKLICPLLGDTPGPLGVRDHAEPLVGKSPSPPKPTASPSTREVNQKGVDLIKSFEGLRLKTYIDAAGHPTIGYGHLIKPAEPYDESTQITEKQAQELLQNDLASARRGVQNSVNVPISDNQFAALVSFTFNLGTGALKSSDLLAFVNKKDFQKAADEFPKWNKARDPNTKKLVELKGLTRRRNAERDLFLSQ
jgi:GH24 family phage-related lysozyme (muramidase)